MVDDKVLVPADGAGISGAHLAEDNALPTGSGMPEIRTGEIAPIQLPHFAGAITENGSNHEAILLLTTGVFWRLRINSWRKKLKLKENRSKTQGFFP